MEDDEEATRIWQTIGTDPVEGARLCSQQEKQDHLSMQARRRRRIAEGYYIGLRLMENYSEWQRFINEPFFDPDPRIRNKKEDRYSYIVMRAVMLYIFDASKSNASLRNRTWRYARAMDGYVEEGVLPEEAAAQIKLDGGIEKLCRLRSKGLNVEDGDKDWKLEMAHGESPPDASREQARDIDGSDHVVSKDESDDDEEDEDEEDKVYRGDDVDEADDPLVEHDPMEGLVVWPVMVEPHDMKKNNQSRLNEYIRVTICARRKDDGTRWYEAVDIDYLG